MKSETLLGKFTNCYAGYTTNDELRKTCASGGIVTQTLLYLLENKLIDGALVSRMKSKLKTETFIAQTPEEIISASGSIYYPVPFFAGANELLDFEGKFAVVGVPCQIKLFRERFSYLEDRAVLFISVFCNHIPKAEATEQLLQKHGIKKEEVERIRYRDEYWPGTLTVKAGDKSFKVLFGEAWAEMSKRELYPEMCSKCHLCMPDEADLCCGDAWLAKYTTKDNKGTSLIICKSQRGQDLLDKMVKDNVLYLEGVTPDEVVQAQPHIFRRHASNQGSPENGS